MTTLGALFLALNKRKHELILLGEGAGSHRKVLTNIRRHWLMRCSRL